MNFWNNRSAKATPTWAIAVVVLLLGLGAVVALDPSALGLQSIAPNSRPGSGPLCAGGYRAPSSYQCVNSATITFALNDGLANGAIGTASITLYYPTGAATGDSCTTASTGQCTTNGKYNTGQALVAYITKSSYISYFQAFTVPPALTSASPPTTLQVPIFDTLLGAWTNTISGSPGGTTFTTGGTYYFSEQTTPVTSLQLSWTLTESTTNAGWVNSYDIFNNFQRNLVFVASDGGDGIQAITGYQVKEIGGTTNYYLFTIPSGVTQNIGQDGVSITGWTVSPSGATQYSNSNAQTTTGGSYVFTFTINRNSETAGTSATWSFKLWYAASATFSPNGAFNIGTPATQSGSTVTLHMVA